MFQALKRSLRKTAAALLRAPSDGAAEQARLISQHMDFGYYRKVANLPGTDETAMVQHYLATGAARGVNPAPWFSSQHYIDTNSDVRDAGVNPFYHYLKWGWAEGRSPSTEAPEGVVTYDFLEDVIAANLDRDFYLDQVNPGRTKVLDAVKHFCAFGWQHDFDPHPEFSTRYYLDQNPDIAARRLNPYFHYLTEGRLEGRPHARSLRAPAVAAPVATPADTLRTGVVSMVKNEGDIIRVFAAHLLTLFDEVVFIDHQSQDDTKEVLEALAGAYPNVHLYRLEEPGYIQDVVSNHIIRECEALRHVDWAMFLDADEFLPFASRQEFRDFLHEQAAYPVISLRWKNLIPENYWDYAISDLGGCRFYVPDQLSPYTKIIIQPAKLAEEDYWINQGNHSVSRARGMAPIAMRDTGVALFHLPIRSANQLAIKLNQGVLSYLRRRAGGDGKQVEGQHWFEILDRLSKEGAISPDLLNGVVHDYGRLEETVTPLDHAALEAAGYACRQVVTGSLETLDGVSPAREENVAELMFQLGGAFAASTQGQQDRSVTRVLIKDGHRIVAAPARHQGHVYTALPARGDSAKAALAARFATPAEAVFTLQADSYLEIRNLPPTAWVGHLPFMFTLASVLQPRRFVELGSHHGASFLSYCQASQRVMSNTQAIAIDCWEGDEHAGFYDNQVFDDFKFMLRPYEGFARYIRDFFDNAVHQFEDGSIDLLHIDGLHTYAAVKNDFETWLPKMSSDGLMLFHDTNVHERDFGVWQLWDELSARYPAAQFMHSHGLGILYVGSEEGSGVRAMVEAMAAPRTLRVLQSHFESVSQLSAALAMRTHEISQHEETLKNAAMKEELFTRLRQRNDSLEAENNTLRDVVRRAQSPEAS